MDNEITSIKDYWEARDQFFASEGVKHYNASLANQMSFYTFDRNFWDLRRMMELHFKLSLEHKLGDFYNREPLHEFLQELTRLLHNFLAGAKMLVDHTRYFVKKTYASNLKAVEEYNSEIARKFGESKVNKFTLDLRAYMAHISMPFISSVIGGSRAKGRDRYTLQLNVKKMGNERQWSSLSKAYIKDHEDEIDLELYLLDYYDLIFNFHRWLDIRVREWSRPVLDETMKLHDQIIRYDSKYFGG